jgi:hypothetical protein
VTGTNSGGRPVYTEHRYRWLFAFVLPTLCCLASLSHFGHFIPVFYSLISPLPIDQLFPGVGNFFSTNSQPILNFNFYNAE